MGKCTTSVAGAVAELSIDAVVGGMSLGAATALGAAIGGAIGLAHSHGRRIVDRIRGHSELAVDDTTLHLLMARQSALLRALLRRGHASLDPIVVSAGSATADDAAKSRQRAFKQLFDEIRVRPGWSRLQQSTSAPAWSEMSREAMQDRVAKLVESNTRAAP